VGGTVAMAHSDSFAVLVNLPSLPFHALTFQTYAMPVEIIPGAPRRFACCGRPISGSW